MPKQRLTKQMIVDAAFAIVRKGGTEALTVKALAQQLGCSVQPIYSYCRSMDGLRAAVAQKARAYVQAQVAASIDPQDLFRSTGRAYIRLAKDEPHIFRLFLFQPREGVASLDELYRTETNPAVADMIAQQFGLSPAAARQLHLHMLTYTIGIGVIYSVTSGSIAQAEIFAQQEQACKAFLQIAQSAAEDVNNE